MRIPFIWDTRRDKVAFIGFVVIPLLLFLTCLAYAGPFDGVRDNPDRYISLDLLGTWNTQGAESVVYQQPNYPVTDAQMYHYHDRGMRGELRIPIDSNTTALIGGNFYTADFSWDPSQTLVGTYGGSKGYGVEAGFRFYLKP